ncbi:uncharacterized protein C12orf81-like [Alligator sinensis]|uniref:Uncharacterized protein C12orf81-like n=1 Tax=Alligator sinensis TaxID=38654 RepID=A0A3Q0HCJ7_ALLSI|nr:uncharacterized protein C12orf81-like [Alligator sinensis]
MFRAAGIALLLLVTGVACDDTAADDIGPHTMGRIAELLSPEECHEFYVDITSPEEDVDKELARLSEEKNPIHARPRRAIASTEQCRDILTQWLRTDGDALYWDRLARALRRIGRPDVSYELGKNLNQDKNLELKRNVDEYHERVAHLTSSLLLEDDEKYGERQRRGQARRARGAGLALEAWDALELVIERRPQPPYNRSLFSWVSPVATGFAGGLLASVLLVAAALYSCLWAPSPDALGPPHHSRGSPLPPLAHARWGVDSHSYPWLVNHDLEEEASDDASLDGEP